jgi:hypothetical protein
MLLYFIVFATGLAGMTQASWWAAAIGGCVLSLKLMYEDRPLLGADATTWEVAQVASNLMISAVASTLAFGAGRLTAQLWGL